MLAIGALAAGVGRRAGDLRRVTVGVDSLHRLQRSGWST